MLPLFTSFIFFNYKEGDILKLEDCKDKKNKAYEMKLDDTLLSQSNLGLHIPISTIIIVSSLNCG